ncbi:MAG TPA: glycosyltransferase family 39 protein [Bryobacteraceae bacterium]
MDQIQRAGDSLVRALTLHQYAFLLLASLGYFAITLYRAERRPFWFDELFTLYISRLPDLRSIWSALTHGVDQNPPMLYLLTHWSQAAFGANELGARIPQVVGFWVFCLCLYRFVSIRTNALAGFIALLLPITTRGYWYAYEARSYGVVLGFFGLALISWQAATDRSSRRWIPLAGLAVSLTGAALFHCYTFLFFVPFGVGELVRTFQRRRLDTAVWCALLIPAIVSVATVLPLLHGLRGTQAPDVIGNPWQNIGSGWDLSVHRTLTLALFLLISAWSVAGLPSGKPLADSFAWHEIACLAGILCTPLVAFCAALAAHVQLFGRYSLITMAGAACLIGAACARSRIVGLLVLFAILVIITKQFAGFRRGTWVVVPNSDLAVGTRSANDNFSLEFVETSAHRDEPIVLMDPQEFAAISHYAPPPIRSWFVYLLPDLTIAGYVRPQQCCGGPGKLTDAQNVGGADYFRLQQCCGAPGTITSKEAFFAAHRSFFVYGGGDLYPVDLRRLSTFFRPPAGEITLLGCKDGRCLFHVALSLETNLIRNQ